jgi:polyisoprenyl-teichoic acid--peptidoglycan teichoic acid transferase
MSPERKDDDQRPDDTQEHELGDDFLEETGRIEEGAEEDEELPSEEPEEEGEDEADLEELIAAETQEWEGPNGGGEEEEEPAGEEVEEPGLEEPAMVAAGAGQARERITSGVRALPRLRPRFPIWLRFTTASFLIVASIAAATAASLILYLGDIASALKKNDIEGVADKLDSIEGGAPETILILGSDKRPEDKGLKFKGLSDTTMLLRLDPDRNAIALFSLPRDLKVEIPGYGTGKLNEAYAYGGPQLTLATVQNVTRSPQFPDGIPIHHLVNVDFEGFARAVNAIDCVYVDVDRRYFHSNDYTSAAADYEEIDLQPGYQALCGFDALDYARYRHEDNDVVRAGRQQDFLREARAKIPPARLFSDRKELISIFTEHTSSDINDPQTMLEVLKLFLEARDAPVKEVHFEGTLGPSYVTATPQQIQTAVNQFLGIEDTPGARAKSAAPDQPVIPESAPDETPATPATPPAGGTGKRPAPAREPSNVTPTSFGKELARPMRNRVAKLPIYYPTVLETGSDFEQKPRVYKINGTGQGSPPRGQRSAYKWVFSRPGSAGVNEYYGFMGTRWTDPPILNDPDDEKTIDGHQFKLFFDGDRLRMVAWQTSDGSFWVSNTLAESLSDREMIEIAEGMKELPGPGR